MNFSVSTHIIIPKCQNNMPNMVLFIYRGYHLQDDVVDHMTYHNIK